MLQKKVSHDLQPKNKLVSSSNFESGDKIQIIEDTDERRQKKTKTVVFVHTETDVCDNLGNQAKMVSTEKGLTRQCACDCCKKYSDLNVVVQRLVELIEEKK